MPHQAPRPIILLRRRGVDPAFVPPISLALATWVDDYISGLTAFRHVQPADSPERSNAAHVWLRTFAGATLRACKDAKAYASQIDDRVEHWRSALGSIRRGSALDLLLDVLPGVPLLTVELAARLSDRSHVAAGSAVNRLAEAEYSSSATSANSATALRSTRSARALHIPGASTRQPNRRHRNRAARPTGAAAVKRGLTPRDSLPHQIGIPHEVVRYRHSRGIPMPMALVPPRMGFSTSATS